MNRGIFVKLCEDEGCPHYGTPHVCNPPPGLLIYEAGTPGELQVIHYRLDEPGTPLDGIEAMLTHWYPSADEISRMIDGNPVALSIVGDRHPWVKLEVPL